MSLSLPQDKLQDAQLRVASIKNRKKVRLRELQSLLGTLSFACRAVVPGRVFLRRLFALTRGVTSPHHWIHFNKEARKDLEAWPLFLSSFNGRVLCLPGVWESSDALKLYTDASGRSFAAVLGSHWFQGDFPESWSSHSIAIKELLPIVLAVQVWGSFLANRCITFFTDNSSVVSLINSQSSKDLLIMSLVRSLVLHTLKFNILFRAKHIPGRFNIIADLLSRSQVDKAFQNAPWLDREPVPMPPGSLPW